MYEHVLLYFHKCRVLCYAVRYTWLHDVWWTPGRFLKAPDYLLKCYHSRVMFTDFFFFFLTSFLWPLFCSVAWTSLSPAVWILPERRATAAALHSTVPARAPVEPPVRQRSQRPPHVWMHRGPAAGHLQPGREYEWGERAGWHNHNQHNHALSKAGLNCSAVFKHESCFERFLCGLCVELDAKARW